MFGEVGHPFPQALIVSGSMLFPTRLGGSGLSMIGLGGSDRLVGSSVVPPLSEALIVFGTTGQLLT